MEVIPWLQFAWAPSSAVLPLGITKQTGTPVTTGALEPVQLTEQQRKQAAENKCLVSKRVSSGLVNTPRRSGNQQTVAGQPYPQTHKVNDAFWKTPG